MIRGETLDRSNDEPPPPVSGEGSGIASIPKAGKRRPGDDGGMAPQPQG